MWRTFLIKKGFLENVIVEILPPMRKCNDGIAYLKEQLINLK